MPSASVLIVLLLLSTKYYVNAEGELRACGKRLTTLIIQTCTGKGGLCVKQSNAKRSSGLMDYEGYEVKRSYSPYKTLTQRCCLQFCTRNYLKRFCCEDD